MKTIALSFELQLKSIPVVIDNGDGTKVEYSLKELSCLDRETVQSETQERYVDDKLVNFKGMQASLLCLALWDDKGLKVSAEKIQQMPITMVNELFTKAQELSGLTDTDQEEAQEALVEAALGYANLEEGSNVDEAKKTLFDACIKLSDITEGIESEEEAAKNA